MMENKDFFCHSLSFYVASLLLLTELAVKRRMLKA